MPNSPPEASSVTRSPDLLASRDPQPATSSQHGYHQQQQRGASDYSSTFRAAPILKLPPEILIQSLSHCDPRDIAASERVCKAWLNTCRDDACWRTAFFTRFEASSAPGRRLTSSAASSTWKAEYLLRSKMLRLWAKSAAKSRVADLKLSHITNLDLLPSGGVIVASTWSGRAQTLSPATLKASKLSLLPDNNLVDEVISCSANPEYIFWATHAQICVIDFTLKSSTRVLDEGMGSISALSGVHGPDNRSQVAVAFMNGHLAIYDARVSDKVWSTSDVQRLVDEDDVPLTAKAIVSDGHYVAAATEHSIHVMPVQQTPSETAHWEMLLDNSINFLALDSGHVLLHEQDSSVISRYVEGRLLARYASTAELPITTITYDFDFSPSSASLKEFGHNKFVAAGHADGSVDVWLWDDPAVETRHQVAPVRNLRPVSHHDDMRVTALATSDLLLFAGYVDGSIRAFDLLGGQLVRVFNEQSTPRLVLRQVVAGQADERRWCVSNIVANDRIVYASVGERLWTWTCTNAVATKKKKKRGPRMSNRSERYQEGADLEDDLLEYEAANYPRRPEPRRNQFSLESLLSPEEAIQYAQLLSTEAEEERQQRIANQSAEMNFDLEQLLTLDEIEDAAVPPSPVVSDNDFEDYLPPSSTYTIGSSTASPFAIRGSTGNSYSPSPTTLSPRLTPRQPSSLNQLSASMEDQAHFPVLSTSPGSRAGSEPSPIGSPPTGSRPDWSSVARKHSVGPCSPSGGASPSPSPHSPSPIGARAEAAAQQPRAGDDEDEDLKLAIQLSLLETRGG